MREIKFRAWDGKEMWGCDDDMIGSEICITFTGRTAHTTRDGLEYTDYDLMEWIGLKDKNGKEIYEGDILKWTHPSFAENKVEYKILIVRDIRNSLLIEQDCAHGWIEIIGNVYENKELIK